MPHKQKALERIERILKYSRRIFFKLLFLLAFLAYGAIFHCILYYMLSYFAPDLSKLFSSPEGKYRAILIAYFFLLTLLAYTGALYAFPWPRDIRAIVGIISPKAPQREKRSVGRGRDDPKGPLKISASAASPAASPKQPEACAREDEGGRQQ